MKEFSLLFLFIVLTMNVLLAQDKSDVSTTGSLLEKSQWRINILPLNLSYEHCIADKSTIYAQAGLDWNRYQNANDSTSNFFSRRNLGVALDLNVQYRYYYNLEKRKNQNRNIASNSGNYVGGQITPLLPPLFLFSEEEVIKETGVIIGAIWGIQRVKKDLLVFNWTLGPALRMTSEGVSPDFQGQISIGFILGN